MQSETLVILLLMFFSLNILSFSLCIEVTIFSGTVKCFGENFRELLQTKISHLLKHIAFL